MKYLPSVLAAVLVLQACVSGTPSDPEPAHTDTTATEDLPADEPDDGQPTGPDARMFDLPAAISNENLDDYYDEKTAKILPEEQENELQLGKLEDLKGNNYALLGEFDCSDRFSTRLILRNSDWTETVGWLVNYSPDNKLIDHLKVFYSDNVEAYRSVASVITPDRVEVTTDAYEYIGNEERVTTTKTSYRIDGDGRFVKLR